MVCGDKLRQDTAGKIKPDVIGKDEVGGSNPPSSSKKKSLETQRFQGFLVFKFKVQEMGKKGKNPHKKPHDIYFALKEPGTTPRPFRFPLCIQEQSPLKQRLLSCPDLHNRP